jgi:hypothetical protein
MHYGYGRYAHHHAFGILDLYDSAISEDPPPKEVWFGLESWQLALWTATVTCCNCNE